MAGHGKSRQRLTGAMLVALAVSACGGCQSARPAPTAWSASVVPPALAAPAVVADLPPAAAPPLVAPIQLVSAEAIIPPVAPPPETVELPAVELVEQPAVAPVQTTPGASYASDLWTPQDGLRPSHRQVILDDFKDSFPTLWDDAVTVYTDPQNLSILGVALGASIGLRQDVDGDVREYTAGHAGRWGRANDWIEPFGNAYVQVPVLFGLYGYSVYTEDDEDLELTRTLIRAYALTGLSTVVVKGVTNTDRPSERYLDGQWGFHSGHTATSFAMAAVLDEYYGHQVGVPAYIMAGLVGWSRIDHREHDLSDVVFGSVLGYVIGKTVAEGVYDPESRFHMLPYNHPTEGAPGIMLHWEY